MARPGRRPSVLNEDQVIDARQRVSRGQANVSRIAQELGVDSNVLRRAVNGTTWGYLNSAVPPVLQKNSGERNQRLTHAQVVDGRRRIRAGETYAGLAREYGVAEATLSHAVRGVTWRDVTEEQPIPHEEPQTPAPVRRTLLTHEAVAYARTHYQRGASISVLADHFSVAETTLWNAIHGISWRSVTDPPPVPIRSRTPKMPKPAVDSARQ